MFIALPKFQNIQQDFQSCTLVMPFFAVGNVGCLAVDSLLATHSSSLIHVGYLDAFRMRVQVALGNDALACDQSQVCGRLHLPLEVFFDKQSSLVVVQQRAPVIKNGRIEFADRLLEWIKDAKFARILTLSSCQASRRIDAQIHGQQFRYFVSAPDSNWSVLANRMQLPALEVEANDFTETAPPAHFNALSLDDESNFPYTRRAVQQSLPTCPTPAAHALTGSHVLRLVYERAQAGGVSMMGLIAFASDAAGPSDGLAFAATAASVLNQLPSGLSTSDELKVPLTWHQLDSEPINDAMYI